MRIADALTGQNLPKADCEVLLGWVLGQSRAYLLAHPEKLLTDEEFAVYSNCLRRRRLHEPVSYITGTHDFYQRWFKADARALIPRSSTEELVRIALGFLQKPADSEMEVDTDVVITTKVLGDVRDVRTVVDVGTGSGCIGITMALERPDLRVIATDISADAISLAKENAELLKIADRMEFRTGGGLTPIQDLTTPFVIVTNPPYIVDGSALMHDVIDYEPHVALFGGKDGGVIPRQIWQDAMNHSFCRGIVMECMTGQLSATLES